MEQRRCHRHRTGPLGHQLLVLHQGEDGGGGLVLADGHDVVHIFLAELIGQLAGGLDLNAVRKGGHIFQGLILVFMQAAVHAGGTLGLHTVDLDLGAQALDGKGHAGDQAAAAHGHDDGIQIGQLVKDLQTNGALTCDDLFVIVGVDEGHAGLGLQLHGLVVGIIIGAGHQTDLRAQALGIFHLHNGGTVRHTDDAPDAPAGGGQSHALCVVASRAGDHALFALLPGELADLIIGSPHLEAAGHLQVLSLEVEAAVLGELGRFNQVGLAGNVLEHKGGVVDLIQSQHDDTSYLLSLIFACEYAFQYKLAKVFCQMNVFQHCVCWGDRQWLRPGRRQPCGPMHAPPVPMPWERFPLTQNAPLRHL